MSPPCSSSSSFATARPPLHEIRPPHRPPSRTNPASLPSALRIHRLLLLLLLPCLPCAQIDPTLRSSSPLLGSENGQLSPHFTLRIECFLYASLGTHERTRWSTVMEILIINSPLGFIGHHAKLLIVVTCAKTFWRGFLFFLTLSPLKG